MAVEGSILLIGDQNASLEPICSAWRAHNLRVDPKASHVLEIAQGPYDAIVILDSRLTQRFAEHMCVQVRTSDHLTPLIVIIQSDNDRDLLELYRSSADGVLTQGTNADFVTVQLKAQLGLIRRSRQLQNYRYDGLAGGSEPTRIEERMLHCLRSAETRVVSREVLCNYVWPNEKVMRHTLDVHISGLRRKLRASNWRLRTVRGRGYSLLPSHRADEAAPASSRNLE